MNKAQKRFVYGSLTTVAATAVAMAIAEKNKVYPPDTTRPNPAAPVQTRQFIHINAPVERVWQVLSGIDQWATWQPDITAPHLNGPLQPGTTFDWKTSGLTIHSTLHTVVPGAAIGWSGPAFGSFAIHNWTLVPQADGSTEVQVAESMEGWLIRLLQPVFQQGLAASIQRWLAWLKQAAEKE